MDAATWLTGIAAIVAAAAGVWLAVHEARRRERKLSSAEIDELTGDLHHCRDEALTCERRLHQLRRTMIDAGIDEP